MTANMQSETGFPSSHQLKSYFASKSRLKLAARAVLSADAGLLVQTGGRPHRRLGFVVRVLGPPTMSRPTWWLLLLCKIWLKSAMQCWICEFQRYASLAWKCLFTPVLSEFLDKKGLIETLRCFIHSKATTWFIDWRNETEYNLLCDLVSRVQQNVGS